MRLLTVHQVLELHREIRETWGGKEGVRSIAALESALAQPQMTFEGQDLYPTLAEKAAAICFSIVRNHPFIDGNKRMGYAVIEIVLLMDGMRSVPSG